MIVSRYRHLRKSFGTPHMLEPLHPTTLLRVSGLQIAVASPNLQSRAFPGTESH